MSTVKGIIPSMKFELKDQSERNTEAVRGKVIMENGVISISLDGYGDHNSPDGQGTPLILENWEGQVRLVVWSNINKEEPTYVIDMGNARENKRREQ